MSMAGTHVVDVKEGETPPENYSAIPENNAASAPPGDGKPAEVTAESLGVTPAQFDKFYSEDKGYNWEAHAKELAFQMAQKPAKEPAAADEAAPEGEAVATEEEARTAVEAAGLDFAELDAQLIETGELTAEQLEAFAKIGIPEDVVNRYVSWTVETAEKHVDDVKQHLGGDQGIAAIKEWAGVNLKPEEVAAYENMLSDPVQWRVAADALLMRAGLPQGPKGSLVQAPNAASPGTTGTQPYQNEAEMIADQRRPEYKSDAEFRNQVMERARISTFVSNPRAHTAGL